MRKVRDVVPASWIVAMLIHACAGGGASVSEGAEFKPQLRENFAVTDGWVRAMAEENGVLYIGGVFNHVYEWSGTGVPVDAVSGRPIPGHPAFVGSVLVVIPDGHGGWFAGGSFTEVGGLPRTNVVHLLSNTRVDPDWRLAVNGAVHALALGPDGLYVGGEFTEAGGKARGRLALAGGADGTVADWNPGADDVVNALLIQGEVIYAGGAFKYLGGQARGGIGALNATTGAATPWNPQADNDVLALAAFDDKIYAGGWFDQIGGSNRVRVAQLDATSGQATAWRADLRTEGGIQGLAYALVGQKDTLYVGGRFSSAGGVPRTNLAALDTISGAAKVDPGLAFASPFDSIRCLAILGDTLYLGGPRMLNTTNGPGLAAAIDRNTGQLKDWNLAPAGTVHAMSIAAGTVFLGGDFAGLNGVARQSAAAINVASGKVTAWNPSVAGWVHALAVSGDRAYIGGDYSTVGGVARANLAAVDTSTGKLTEWAPKPTSQISVMTTHQGTLYVAGTFVNIAGQSRTNLAAFELPSGRLTAWNPGFWPGLSVKSLLVVKDTLLIGGNFLLFPVPDFQSAKRELASVDLLTGKTSFWPSSSLSASVNGLAVVGNSLYAAGRFGAPGSPVQSTIAFDLATEETLPWNKDSEGIAHAIVAATDQVLVASGPYKHGPDGPIDNLAALDKGTGALLPWTPGIGGLASTLLVKANTLYVGGTFFTVSGQARNNLAAFKLTGESTPVVELLPASFRVNANGLEFQFQAPAGSQITIQASSDLITWETVDTVAAREGVTSYANAQGTGTTKRFYRLRKP